MTDFITYWLALGLLNIDRENLQIVYQKSFLAIGLRLMRSYIY